MASGHEITSVCAPDIQALTLQFGSLDFLCLRLEIQVLGLKYGPMVVPKPEPSQFLGSCCVSYSSSILCKAAV